MSLRIRGRLVQGLPVDTKICGSSSPHVEWHSTVGPSANFDLRLVEYLDVKPVDSEGALWEKKKNDQREKVRPCKMLIQQVRGVYEDLV